MKFTQLVTASIVSLGLVFAGASASFAESGYCTGVKILNAGAKVSGSTVVNQVRVENPSNSCGNFATGAAGRLNMVLMAENADAMLATALTALSLGKPVTIVSAGGDTYTNGGTIVSLFVND